MFVHVFSFEWKDAATEEDRQRALAQIARLKDDIPEILDLWLGQNVSPTTPHLSTTGVMRFASQDAFRAYCSNPHHTALLEWLVPLIRPVEIDFEA